MNRLHSTHDFSLSIAHTNWRILLTIILGVDIDGQRQADPQEFRDG